MLSDLLPLFISISTVIFQIQRKGRVRAVQSVLGERSLTPGDAENFEEALVALIFVYHPCLSPS